MLLYRTLHILAYRYEKWHGSSHVTLGHSAWLIDWPLLLCNYLMTEGADVPLWANLNTPNTDKQTVYIYLMYGRKAKDRKNPDTKPQMWAKLSIQGSKPKEKKKTEMASSLANARHGRSRICQLWNSSTNRQARMPNWLPAGPTWDKTEGTGWRLRLVLFGGLILDTVSCTQLVVRVTLYLCSVGQEDGWGQVACDTA